MEEWEAMGSPRTAASYYMQRGAVPVSGGSRTQLDSPMSAHGVNVSAEASKEEPDASAGVSEEEANADPARLSEGEPVRRKPGRPRKRRPDGHPNQNLPVQSNLGGNSNVSEFQPDSSSPISEGEPIRRRRPGRPRKSGIDCTASSLVGNSVAGSAFPPPSHGEWLSGSSGMGLTPDIITIAVGEDIVKNVMSFLQQGPRVVCILSANGAVSTVTLRQPSTSRTVTVKFEGHYEILSLSGSYMLTGNEESCSRTGGLSVSLCSHDGQVICGAVDEMLVAATPVQVIVGSFVCSGSQTTKQAVVVNISSDSSADSESSVDGDN